MKMTHCLTVATGLALLCSSCAKQDAQTSQPVKQPAQKTVTKKAPRKAQPKTNTETQTLLKEPGKVKQFEPPAPSSSSNPFRAPVDDIKLPTDAEMAEGKESASQQAALQQAQQCAQHLGQTAGLSAPTWHPSGIRSSARYLRSHAKTKKIQPLPLRLPSGNRSGDLRPQQSRCRYRQGENHQRYSGH